MEYVENVMNQAQDGSGVNFVTLKDLQKILKIGLAETKLLMCLYNNHNLMLYIIQNILNGCLLKIFKMLLTLPEEVLVKFIRLNGLKDIFIFGISKIKNGIEIQMLNLH